MTYRCYIEFISYLKDKLPYDEKDLLRQVAAGNEAAFRKLLHLYGDRFYAVAKKMTRSEDVAKDIVQDVFISIWEKRRVLNDVKNPASYFFTIIYRRIYTHFRKIASERNVLHIVSAESQYESPPEDKVLAKEDQELMNAAIAQLPPRQQLVFRLSKQEGLTREDIAIQLNVSPNTVKNHLADAMKSIKIFLLKSYNLLTILFFFKKDLFG